MKINWFSNAPWATTGYGNQTKLFVPRLQSLGHELTVTAFYGLQGSVINMDGVRVYPTVKHPYGQDVMTAHAVHAGAKCIISLLDIWVVDVNNVKLPWFPWFPIDHEPMPGNVLAAARHATKGIVYSRFGEKMAKEAGLDVWYVPHGVDTKAFRPVDRAEARAKMGLPQDCFLVGMVAANKGNPSRKAFFEQIAAFAALKKMHSDAVLYLHTDEGTRGGEVVNLINFINRVGLVLGKDVWFCDQYINAIGFHDEYMRAIYNAMDVLTSVSLGEGFGIPILEAQACGTPVITGDWTAMPEITFSGWKVDRKEAEPIYHDYFDAFQFQPSVGAITERMLSAYQMRGNMDYRTRAEAGAQAYDADKVTQKYWKPVLEQMEKLVDERAESHKILAGVG